MKKLQQQQTYMLPPDEENEDGEQAYIEDQQNLQEDQEDDYGQQQIDEDEDEDGDEVVDQVAETIPRSNQRVMQNQPMNQMQQQNPYAQQQQQQFNGGGMMGQQQMNMSAGQGFGGGGMQMNPNFYAGTKGSSQNRLSQMPQPMMGQGPVGVGGRMRPQSAKVNDNNQLKFQQQQQQQQNLMGYGGVNPQWVGQGMYAPHQQNFMVDPNIAAAYQMQQQQNINPNGMISNGFYGGIPLGGKKRPTTASRKGNNGGLGQPKKSFPSKVPSQMDLEVSKLRPKMINQERERLYEDAIKQKMTANYLKEENVRLKTKIHKMEAEMGQKERLIDDLLLQQDSFQTNQVNNENGMKPPKSSKTIKLEGHLAMNLKRKIRELQIIIAQKHEECVVLKKNIKSTKTAELEVEIKMFSDECVRLRHQLEEVIKSKDTFADPEELKIIQGKFNQQDQLIVQLRSENTELAQAYSKKEDENRQLREMFTDLEKKTKKAIETGKAQAKLKKTVKAQDKEVKKLQSEVAHQKALNDDYRAKIEEMVKKGSLNNQQQSNQNSYMLQNQSHSNIPNSKAASAGGNNQALNQQLQEKEQKVQELNTVVQQLQAKLQEKMNELGKEQQDKDKFKKLYEQYQDEVVSMQAQLEDAGLQPKPMKSSAAASNRPKSAYRPGAAQQNQSIDSKLNQSKAAVQKSAVKEENEEDEDDEDDYSQSQSNFNSKPSIKQQPAASSASGFSKASVAKQSSPVDQNKAKEIAMELKLKLQSKGFFYHQINEFFFKPYQKEATLTQKQLIQQQSFSTLGMIVS